MAVSRRFIITSLRDRKIYPGSGASVYATEIFKFLLEVFEIREEALDPESKQYLTDTATAISTRIREFMNLGNTKPTVRLDRVLSGHKVFQ